MKGRWLPVPTWAIILAAIVFLAGYGYPSRLARTVGLRAEELPDDVWVVQFTIQAGAICGLAFLCGASRAAHHPAMNLSYLKWLANSPWRPGSPLPLGTSSLTWIDWTFVALLGLVAQFVSPILPIIVILAFLAGYFLIAVQILAKCKHYGGIGLLILCPPAAILIGSWWAALAVALTMSLIAWRAICTSWVDFPWGIARYSDDISKHDPSTLGWPFDRLNGIDPTARVNRTIAAGLGLTIGWWTFAVAVAFHRNTPLVATDVAFFITVVGSFGALFRLLAYMGLYRPPMSLRGRFTTRSFIIPSYDRILVAPAIIFVVGYAGPWLLFVAKVPSPLVAGVIAGLIVGLSLGLPPSLRNWKLTGGHRMLVPLVNRSARNQSQSKISSARSQ